MKKIVLIIALIGFTLGINAQKGKLSVGGNLGANILIASVPSFVVGGDIDYLLNSGSKFNVGVASGILFSPIETSISFPIAGAVRFELINSVSLGLDTGYALTITRNSPNGFYFRPIFEYKLQPNLSLRTSYSNIGSAGYINTGLMFTL